VTTLMWEAVSAPGRRDELTAWASGWRADGLESKEVYAAGERIVLVAHFSDAASAERANPVPPDGTLARDGHAWTFERVG
jgi:hypothetical protein